MPLPVIRAARVLLRPVTREDVDPLHALWTAPDVRRYLWDKVVIGRDAVQQIVETHLGTSERYGIGLWALHVQPVSLTEAPIGGFCGFRFIENKPDIELVYGIAGQHWGKGLATEACFAALDYLWQSTTCQVVFALADPPNVRSVAVMRRLGMTHLSSTASMITYVLHRPSV